MKKISARQFTKYVPLKNYPLTFIGYETTANLLLFAIVELHQHPEVMKR
jgi:hypothetical protein